MYSVALTNLHLVVTLTPCISFSGLILDSFEMNTFNESTFRIRNGLLYSAVLYDAGITLKMRSSML